MWKVFILVNFSMGLSKLTEKKKKKVLPELVHNIFLVA